MLGVEFVARRHVPSWKTLTVEEQNRLGGVGLNQVQPLFYLLENKISREGLSILARGEEEWKSSCSTKCVSPLIC